MKIIGYGVGIFCLGYFFCYAFLTGLTNKFTYFWFLLGMFCIGISFFSQKLMEISKNLPVVLKILGVSMITIGGLVFLGTLGILIFYGNSVPKPAANYMIVLGAQVRGKTPSYNLARRLDAAYEYLKKNPETIVILSGGQGEGEEISEAEAMAIYLEEKGISRQQMILEDQSRNTHENIMFSREKMENEQAEVIVVTNNFHVFRGVKIAKKQGLTNVQGLGSPVMWFTIPNMYVREVFAVLKYALFRQI